MDTLGRVILLNQEKNRGAIRTEKSEYTVFHKLSPGDIDVGDEVYGNLDSLGNNFLTNLTKGSLLIINIQDTHGVVAAKAKRLVGI
ncbi:MAG: hypothetical protein HQK54_02530 [Oligoflexales bacterium]|nr:hypothetical protein [Oligoflexales bacterium]